MEVLLNKDGALCVVYRQWLNKDDAMKLFNHLYETTWWIEGKDKPITIYGKTIPQPRKTYMMGDDKVRQQYSGTTYEPGLWQADIFKIKSLIEKQLDCSLNSCLLNLYVDGKSSIGYHGDREAKKDNDIVVILSLGGTRDFYIKENANPRNIIKTKVNNGDLMLMYGTIQRLYKHSVPKRARAEPRISASFRLLE